jgi:hypothetical protein
MFYRRMYEALNSDWRLREDSQRRPSNHDSRQLNLDYLRRQNQLILNVRIKQLLVKEHSTHLLSSPLPKATLPLKGLVDPPEVEVTRKPLLRPGEDKHKLLTVSSKSAKKQRTRTYIDQDLRDSRVLKRQANHAQTQPRAELATDQSQRRLELNLRPLLQLKKETEARIRAYSYVVMDPATLRIYVGCRTQVSLEVASLTKVMTCVTVLRILAARQLDMALQEHTISTVS